jgi:hypothetical protein
MYKKFFLLLFYCLWSGVREILFAAYCLSGFSLAAERAMKFFYLSGSTAGFCARENSRCRFRENGKHKDNIKERKKILHEYAMKSQMWKILVNLKAHLKI